MATTTTKGYKLGTNGDRGSWWEGVLNFNTKRINTHKHDGNDSELIKTTDLDKQVQDILSASWTATTGQAGTFEQEVTMPAGFVFPKLSMQFFVNGGSEDGSEVFPSIVKTATDKYKIYVNDNSLALKAIYA